jgi:molybdenum cofactor cytidylyltransferase
MSEAPTEAGAYHAVVLAAGAGTRFGGGKLRANWRGKPLIRWAVEAACASPAVSVAVVTGADPEVGAAARCDCGSPLVVIGAMDWSQGLSASLRAGFSSAHIGAKGVFVFLGDMPRVPHDMAQRLCAALTGGAKAAAPVCGGRRGHPVLVGRELAVEVATLGGDAGLGAVLDGLGPALALVETDDDGVLFDVDTPDQLEP